jgi:hypothetical protein
MLANCEREIVAEQLTDATNVDMQANSREVRGSADRLVPVDVSRFDCSFSRYFLAQPLNK